MSYHSVIFAGALHHRPGLFAAIVAVASAVLLAGCREPSLQNSLSQEQASFTSGTEIEALIQAGFLAHDPDYREHQAAFGPRLRALAGELAAIQATGNDMPCSNQIYLEAKWLFQYTVDWVRLDRKLTQLSDSLKNHDQAFALQQTPETHLWGVCYDELFPQAEEALTWLDKLYEEDRAPTYRIKLPERIGTPAKLEAALNSLLVSDIAATGRDNRGELGNITTSLSQVLFKDRFRGFLQQKVAPEQRQYELSSFQAVYENFVRRWQDPQSGYWGAWYRFKGRIYKSPDLSITYHIIAYRGGEVAYWPQIIDTTLRIEDEPYPFGWRHDAHFTNHNNYDVVRILKFGWPHMSAVQRLQAANAIHSMLDWTLKESLNQDGSFKLDPAFFSSLAAEYYFGVSFLDQAGYWDRKKRFWTSESFPNGVVLCRVIRARLLGLGLKDPQALHALEKLNSYCGT